MMVFEGVIAALASVGIFELYMPFLLLFAIFFAILSKTKIFDNKNIDVLLSFIISLYVVAFSPVAGVIGFWFAGLFAAVGVTLVAIIVFFLVIGLLISPWWSKALESKSWKWLIPLGVVVAFLLVLGSSFGGVAGAGEVTIPGLSSQDLVFLTLVIITLIIIYWMTRGAGGKGAKEARMLFEPM